MDGLSILVDLGQMDTSYELLASQPLSTQFIRSVMNSLTDKIKQHPVVSFYILAFAISWIGWIPEMLYAYKLFPFDNPLLNLLGGLGPTFAAVIILLVTKEKDGIKKLFGALFKWKISIWMVVFAFSFWIVLGGLVIGLGKLFGQPFPVFSDFQWGSLVLMFGAMMLNNVWEEIGWRGFALPRLQNQFSDLKIILIMGLLWNLWHLPLMFNPASGLSILPWYEQVVFFISLTVILTWLHQNTRQSLLYVTIFHAGANTLAFVFSGLGILISLYSYIVMILAIAAVVIILVHGTERFSKVSQTADKVTTD